MPVKTGLSHAVGAFVSLLLSTVFETYLEQYELVGTFTHLMGHVAVELTGGALTSEQGGPVVVTLIIAFVWGVIYHRHRFTDHVHR